MASNRLAAEKSPYLLQHKDNPVAWYAWGEEAFAAAKAENKPVFLSIGYSTCHWCHVMAHESFESADIARQMNEHFINIKVDREERPDVDRLYMAFVQATTGSGGWPMSVWLTPEGKPFFGGTYFPPADRHGRAGFPNVLQQISQLWQADRERIEAEGSRVMQALRETSHAESADAFSRDTAPLQRALENFSRSYDEDHGGFGGAPKFPRPSVFNFLFRSTNARAQTMALETLRHMAAGGMRDHLGGGFHRYSVDAYWHVPHFEKMLYDQAQLATSYVEAWQLTHEADFEKIARQTLDYVLRDLRDPAGGFYSAEDADSLFEHGRPEHGEGAFYVWTKQEILDVLGPEDARIFGRHYVVEETGNAPAGSDPHDEFAGKNILVERHGANQTAKLAGLPLEDVERSLAASREKLLARRNLRPRPHLDDKVLTAWNGLMISAFARAGVAFGELRYLEAAEAAATFIRENLSTPNGLLRTWRGEAGTIAGFAEDYAFLIQGLLDLYEATFHEAWFAWAVELQDRQDALFWDEDGGNYFSSTAQDPLVPLRLKDDYDGAEPSANSVSALNLLRLARMRHEDTQEERASRIIAAAKIPLERVPTAIPQMLVALDLALAPSAQAVVAGNPGDADVQAWLSRLHHDFFPRRVLRCAAPGNTDGALDGMKPVDGKAALYLCENFACQAPQTL